LINVSLAAAANLLAWGPVSPMTATMATEPLD
jgi:hypothetical protein